MATTGRSSSYGVEASHFDVVACHTHCPTHSSCCLVLKQGLSLPGGLNGESRGYVQGQLERSSRASGKDFCWRRHCFPGNQRYGRLNLNTVRKETASLPQVMLKSTPPGASQLTRVHHSGPLEDSQHMRRLLDFSQTERTATRGLRCLAMARKARKNVEAKLADDSAAPSEQNFRRVSASLA
eukprot:3553774-Rhodomonas_salina.1